MAKKIRARVSADDLSIFTRQMATMIGAGIPLLESLEIMAEQVLDPKFKRVVTAMAERVRAGSDLSEAFAEHPHIFNRIFINMIRAGEVSGELDVILNRLAEYMEKAAQLRRKIKSAMTYPAISLTLILGILVLLLAFVVPKFREIFESVDVKLPAPTLALIALSDFVVHNWPLLLGCVVAVAAGLYFFRRTPQGQMLFDHLILVVPVFGNLFRKVAISRFSRTFATLIQSGVPILGALEIVKETAGNVVVAKVVGAASENVRQGENLAGPLSKGNVFPPMVTRMIAIGERTGALETLLTKISEFYDQQVAATVESLTALMEPLLIAVMGVTVGGIVICIFLPIFELQKAMTPS